MFVDTHSHLAGWSPDAAQTVEELLQAAWAQQLDGIIITDHYDIDSVTVSGRQWTFDPVQYYKQNERFRIKPSTREPGDPIGLLIGIEISYQEAHIGRLKKLIQKNQFDSVILSLHDYKGADPLANAKQLFQADLTEVYTRIIEKIAESAERFPEADVIGHYDFFSRYAPGNASKMRYRHAPDAFDRLFRAMVRNNQALEINTGTIEALHKRRGYTLQEAMPDVEIISRYRELGGTLFTLGADAHCEADVARYFPQTAAWLYSQGVQDCSWFEEHNAQRAPLLQAY